MNPSLLSIERLPATAAHRRPAGRARWRYWQRGSGRETETGDKIRRHGGATRLLGMIALWLITLFVADPAVADGTLLRSLARLAQPLAKVEDLDPLVDAASHARLVLLGEASHGTHEFYLWRDRLSRRLIEDREFSFVAIEGDWATLLPLDRYVRHRRGAPRSARDALRQVRRWPRWVWANTELAAFAEWLHRYNADRPPHKRVGIHGIDLYTVWQSLDALRDFYDTTRPHVAAPVRRLSRILMRYRDEPRSYARSNRHNHMIASHAIAKLLADTAVRFGRSTPAHREHLFEIAQHAHVLDAGERYLRLLAGPSTWSWNLRSAHFDQTVARLLDHYGPDSRGIVWAHNTHVGDARGTAMAFTGERNLGQLSRERFGKDAVFIVGLGTGSGDVLAARRWEGQRETFTLPSPRPDSLEAALMASGTGDRWLMLQSTARATGPLHRWLPHRAVGVVFEPDREPTENYVPTRLGQRYDAFIFFPQSRPLTPLPTRKGVRKKGSAPFLAGPGEKE